MAARENGKTAKTVKTLPFLDTTTQQCQEMNSLNLDQAVNTSLLSEWCL